MRFPSGDHRGDSIATPVAMLRWFVPSTFATNNWLDVSPNRGKAKPPAKRGNDGKTRAANQKAGARR